MTQQDPEQGTEPSPAPGQTGTPPTGPGGPPDRRRTRPRFGRILILVVVVVLVAIVGAGVGLTYYNKIRVSHPAEETAAYVPASTALYLSFNMRPGASQLSRFRRILERFQENPNYQDRIDDGLNRIEEESGFDLREDLFPWIGPELAVAIVDFNGVDDLPNIVTFLGTTDPDASNIFVERFVDYLEDEQDMEFELGRAGGFTTYNHDDPSGGAGQHFVATDDYLVFATTARLLNRTVDMIQEPRNPLSETEKFQESQRSAQDPRFAMLYVDLETIFGDLRRDLEGPELDIVQTLQDNLPGILTSSAALFDMGVKVAGSFESTGTVGGTPSNALTSTDYLPSDTLAFLSTTGVNETWTQIREQLEGTLEVPFDFEQLTRDFEQGTGLNLDMDIFSWMTGEAAFAFLPSTFTLGSFGSVEEALIQALAMIEFADRAAVGSALDKIINTLQDQGIRFESVTIDGEEALLADLGDILGTSDYQPGYVILDNHVVVGTTQQSLQLALDTRAGELQSMVTRPRSSAHWERAQGPISYCTSTCAASWI